MSDPQVHVGSGEKRPQLLHFEGLVPLVVGVAGHRDPVPTELPRIREEVERALVEVLALGGRDGADRDRRETPIVVVSSLAEGGDRLVARVVLDRRAGEPAVLTAGRGRLRLAAVLPMDAAAYETTFEGIGYASRADSIADFEALHQRANLQAVLREPREEAPCGPEVDPRTRAFERMAAFLAWHSHVLLALWNGEVGKRGGTADSVAWFTGESAPDFAPPEDCIDAPDGLLLLRVHTPRLSPAQGAMDVARVMGRLDPRRAERVFRQIEGFNRDVVAHGFRAVPEGGLLPPEAMPYEATYVAADGLSRSVYRRRTGRSARTLLALVIASILCFEAFSHLTNGAWPLLAAYVVLSIWAIRHLGQLRTRETEERDLVYRSFAEALRVQRAWATAGLDDWAGDHYAAQHHNELEWARQAMKGLYALSTCAPGGGRPPQAERIQRAVDTWVRDQERWFRGSRVRQHGTAEAHEACVRQSTLVASGMALVLLVLLVLVHLGVLAHAWHDPLHRFGSVAVFLALATAGLVHQWAAWKCYSIAAKRYEDAAALFARARAEVRTRLGRGSPGDLVRAQQVLRALGASALAENTSWLLLHRDHVLEIHGH